MAESLTELIVNWLASHPDGCSTMQLVLALRRPYNDVWRELAHLENLGIVMGATEGRQTRWLLG